MQIVHSLLFLYEFISFLKAKKKRKKKSNRLSYGFMASSVMCFEVISHYSITSGTKMTVLIWQMEYLCLKIHRMSQQSCAYMQCMQNALFSRLSGSNDWLLVEKILKMIRYRDDMISIDCCERVKCSKSKFSDNFRTWCTWMCNNIVCAQIDSLFCLFV